MTIGNDAVTVAEAVGRTVAGLGASHCFGVVGSVNFHVTNALVDAGVPFVAARHETGAVTMADAYARMTGTLAVASVHPGPGVTNALTGIAEAAKSRTPLLVLAGDTANGAIQSNFDVDQAALAASVGATPERIHSVRTALADTVRAVQRAVRERRTVVLNLPQDVQEAMVPADAPVPALVLPERPAPAAEAVETLAARIAAARAPLLVAGRGALLSGAGPALRRLGEHAGALLATSACAHGLFADDPWALGISGGFASPVAVELITASDLVVGFGVSFTQWTTRNDGLLPPGTTVVQVDVDTERFGHHRPVDQAVVGDAKATAEALLAALGERGPAATGRRTRAVRERIASGSYEHVPYTDTTGGGVIDPRTLTKALDRILPAERTVVLDSGHFMGWPARHLRVPDEQGWVFTQSFQSIGLGLATAIGAAEARPDRLTVVALGDGGGLMGMAEMETAVRLGHPMVLVFYNDAVYAAEVHHFGPQGYPTKIVEFPDPDIASVARGYGAQAVTVRAPEDLAAVEEWVAAGAQGILAIDAKVTPTLVADWLEEAFRGMH